MKKLIYIFGLIAIVFTFSGCDYIYAPNHYYVSVYNDESDKYITTLYYRDYCYGQNVWSRNMIGSYVYPYEYFDMIFDEGTYDFKVYMEDDYYSYEIDILSVYVYENTTLDVCYDCYGKDAKVNITRTPKNKENKDK
jgi:hypothetical protein